MENFSTSVLTQPIPSRVRAQIPRGPLYRREKETSPTPDGIRDSRKALELESKRYKCRTLAKDHTRLLVLYPPRKSAGDASLDHAHPNQGQMNGASAEELLVDVVHIPFNDLGTVCPYEALSYHWGAGSSKWPINVADDCDWSSSPESSQDCRKVVESHHGVKSLWVRHNSYLALQSIRMPDRPLKLWVDAISINQQDEVEKQQQVSRINEVFSRANRVLIWLGPETDKSAKGMKFIDKVIALQNLKTLTTVEDHLEDWENLLHLMRRDWFSRRWVIQELALAQYAVVKCGKDERDWRDFRDAISLFDFHFDTIRHLLRDSKRFKHDFHALGEVESLGAKLLVDTINNIFRDKEQPPIVEYTSDHELINEEAINEAQEREPMQSLEFLVSLLSSFEATDPRDAIHALRNIAKETFWAKQEHSSIPAPPEPDYQKSLLQVYSEFIKWIVRSSGSIDILCRHWAIPERDNAGPSKVVLPSWIQCNREGPFGRQQMQQLNSTGFRIGGDSFVGLPGHGSYKASRNKEAVIWFGNEKTPVQQIVSLPGSRVATEDVSGKYSRKTTGVHTDTGLQAAFCENCSSTKITFGEQPTNQNEAFSVNGHFDNGEAHQHLQASNNPGTLCRATSLMVDDNYTKDKVSEMEPHTVAGAEQAAEHVTSSRVSSVGSRLNRTMTSGWRSRSSTISIPDAHEERRRVEQQCEGHINAFLHVAGLEVGTISWYSDATDGMISSAALQRLADGVDFASEEDYEPSDKLWRTLVAERGADGRNPPTWYYRACCYCLAKCSPTRNLNVQTMMQTNPPDIVLKFLKRVLTVVWNRRFLELKNRWTQEELVGIGPGKLRPGDKVCILFGCSVPVVLRPQEDEAIPGKYYSFVGEAYVYGLMDGEAISKLGKEVESKKEIFHIL